MQDKSTYVKRIRLGEVLTAWRSVRGLSVRQAGARMRVHYGTLNRLERGNNPDGRTLARVLRFLLEEV